MNSYVAEIGEIVRAQRRDDEFINEIQEKLSKIFKELVGQRTWIRWFPYFRTISQSLYYSNTILAGNQTLGEEYVHLFESSGLSRFSPSFPTRFSFIFLHSILPQITNHLLQKAELRLNHPSTTSFLGVQIQKNAKARKTFIDLVTWTKSTFLPNFQRCHVALFYITGSYYNLARRVTGIRFLSANSQSDLPALKIYRILGYLSIIQVVFIGVLGIWRIIEEASKKPEKSKEHLNSEEVFESLEHSWFSCPICLEKKDPSALFCGHLFCWNCIQEHSTTSQPSRCPQCRLEYEPRDVTPLLNL
ncbi:unnamed protein product [Caenorhabditis angaria]|uniref:RING-type E3 ubiquitin transferase n=1 Tax=Caenorhabditis angaria TaxID=860376 RepID=A0A9P1IL59_9PELO|nr:unnamed protein product [Caenorhabditis angaria]